MLLKKTIPVIRYDNGVEVIHGKVFILKNTC